MVPWSQFNFPWSGDVVQSIDPEFFFGSIKTEAGDGLLEKKIFDTASYGRQLGLITEVLLTLVEKAKLDPVTHESLKKLTEIHAAVEKIKEEHKANIEKNARRFLDKLKETDKDAYNAILSEYKPQP